jgi:uncharacterized protein GlcG (DUF336 family)
MAVVVLDQAGHIITLEKQDGALMIASSASIAKAYGAISFQMSSRTIETIAKDRPELMQSVYHLTPGKILAAAGACLIIENGQVIGAAAASGDTSDNDELCAIAGIHAAGYQTEK